MRVLAVFFVVTMALFAHADPLPNLALRETARLNTWLDAQYEQELAFSPMSLTRMGSKERYDQIDDFSEAAADALFEWRQGSVAELKRLFDVHTLSPEGQTSYDFWIYRLRREQAGLEFRRHAYVFDQINSMHTAFPEFLINDHTVESGADMQAYIARVRGAARALGQLLERAQLAATDGIRPPRFAYEAVLEESRKIINVAPFFSDSDSQSSLWLDGEAKIDRLRSNGIISQQRATEYRAALSTALVGDFKRSYERLIGWIEKDLPNSDIEPKGVSDLPSGDKFYSYCLANHTTTSSSADEIYAIGLREIARIREQMTKIKEAADFEGDLSEFFAFVRHDQQFYYSNDDAGRAEYIAATEAIVEKMQHMLPQYFATLPKAQLQVKRVEAFRESAGGAPHYITGRPDGTVPGTYYLHLSNMKALNRVVMQSNAYHEGTPGHHLQSSIALESNTLPMFRTSVWYSSYGEGWALYAEQLAKEMGFYTDVYSDFGRLALELLRALRLVVDTGIHVRGWSEQRAVDFFLANSAMPEVIVRNEVQRYFVWPGQATSYTIGKLNILDLRAEASTALGTDFDIRGFHDVILGGGSLPQHILAKQVRNWVEQQRI